MTLLASVGAALGDVTRARTLYRGLSPYAERIAFGPPEFSTGSVSRSLGILASALSLWEEAEEHFVRALEANERMRARPWIAHTRHDWARMLLDRGRPGDRERALQLAGESVAAYRELGMDPWAGRAADLKRSAEAAVV
jgi:hypothetical protein